LNNLGVRQINDEHTQIPMNKVTYRQSSKFTFRECKIGDHLFSEKLPSTRNDLDARRDFYLSYLSKELQHETAPGKKFTYVDLFCGGGGMSLGVQNAAKFFGYNPRLACAVDLDENALKLVQAHFKPLIARAKSVEDLMKYAIDLSGNSDQYISKPQILDTQLAQFKGRIDLLIGGPPCQGHSNLNNKTRRFDPRNLLYLAMPSMAIALDIPKIIIENVQTITKAKENVVKITKSLLKAYGYSVEEKVIDCSLIGVAQTRQRHFLVARKGTQPNLGKMLNSFKSDPLSFDEVCGTLPSLPAGDWGIVNDTAKMSDANSDRINYLHDNNIFDLPNHERPVCHQEGTSYSSVYGRINGSLPMTTITTGFASPGRGRYVHPHERRCLSIREAGRIQGFPDWYWRDVQSLGVKRGHLHKVVGDAVPSLVAYPILASLLF